MRLRKDRPAALFLDRDGVINDLVYYPDSGEFESPRQPSHLQMQPEIGAPLREARAMGYLIFLVSNQPSAAKGKTSLDALQSIHDVICEKLRAESVALTASYYCYHHPRGVRSALSGLCLCRKPSPLFLKLAASEYGIDLSASWMIGDQDTDVQCGQRAGCRTALLDYGPSQAKRTESHPSVVAKNLHSAIAMILQSHCGGSK